MGTKAKGTPASEKLVVCVGGPRNRGWYTEEWWQELVSSERADHRTAHDSQVLGYVLTDGRVDHPVHHGASGRVLRWNPDRAAELLGERS